MKKIIAVLTLAILAFFAGRLAGIGNGNPCTEAGRYRYASRFPEIRPPIAGRIRRK